MPDQPAQNDDRYKLLFDTSSDAIMLLDEKGFFECNPATLKIFGYSSQAEFCGKHPSQHSPPTQPDGTNSMELANKQIAEAMEKGSNAFEWVHRRSTGEDFPAEVRLTAFILNGKKVLQATVRDESVRKQHEELLNKKNLELSAINRAMVGRELKMIELKAKIAELEATRNQQ